MKGVCIWKDILASITAYREERGWTEYQLAERSGLPQSSISSWYRKNIAPTIPSLKKICIAFCITAIRRGRFCYFFARISEKTFGTLVKVK